MRSPAPLLTCLLILLAPVRLRALPPPQPAQGAGLQIVSFGPAVPVVFGDDSVLFVGTVRNNGAAPVEANSVTVRLLALAGLNYTEGDTAPKLPALAPGESTMFRWKLQPARPDAALVASMALVAPGSAPVVRVVAVQQLARMPGFPDLPLSATPAAWSNSSHAWLQNDRIRVRVALSNSGVPMMWLAAWTGTAWQTVGVSLPIAEVLSAEGSQQPWWEVFRAETMTSSVTATSAHLSIVGGAGIRWRATVTIDLRRGSSVARIGLRLAPLRAMRLSGVRLAALHAQTNGSAPLLERCGAFQVAAINRSGVTSGGLWTADPPVEGWLSAHVDPVEGASYRTLGAEYDAPANPSVLATGSPTEFQARLFAVSESDTAHDASRVAVGPPLKAPSWAKTKPPSHSSHTRKGRHNRPSGHVRRGSSTKRKPGTHRKPAHRIVPKRRPRARR